MSEALTTSMNRSFPVALLIDTTTFVVGVAVGLYQHEIVIGSAVTGADPPIRY